MRRLPLVLLGLGALATPVRAQQVPGRDLLEFPLGVLADPQALARADAGGLWNPAQIQVSGGRLRVTAAALNTPIEQGVTAWYLAAAGRAGRVGNASLTVVRALVADLLRTDTDPQSIGEEIPYHTTVVSAGLSRALHDLTVGVAVRHRTGVVDVDRGGATSLDAGVALERVGRLPIRVGASTFLLSPFARSRERARFMLAADAPVYTRGGIALRAGGSLAATEEAGREEYVYAHGTWGWLQARGGVAREHFAGSSVNRLRLGFGLHYARYEVGVAREDGGAGLGPTYQFMLTSVFR